MTEGAAVWCRHCESCGWIDARDRFSDLEDVPEDGTWVCPQCGGTDHVLMEFESEEALEAAGIALEAEITQEVETGILEGLERDLGRD